MKHFTYCNFCQRLGDFEVIEEADQKVIDTWTTNKGYLPIGIGYIIRFKCMICGHYKT